MSTVTKVVKPLKTHRFTFNARCLSSDNQLAVCVPLIKYQAATKQDGWFDTEVKDKLERIADDYINDRNLWDLTSGQPKHPELLKLLNESLKTIIKGDAKPSVKIKIEEVSLSIKRDR